ncbi:hypothetical protein [Bdellovibrio sp. BCCA]|uniref:hypothetical protein n=1 Tax=Bdellovibrio sp. BCCA TaxID=3136281 RepID=UPI0030F2B554
MSSGVDWKPIFDQWTPSGGAQEITDKDLIKDLIELMNYCVCNGGDSLVAPMSARAMSCFSKDKTGKWDVLQTAADQLKEHGRAWKTHLEQTQNLTVEYPVVIKDVAHVRYFKVQIKDGATLLKQPKNVKHVAVNYHEATQTIEVKYV